MVLNKEKRKTHDMRFWIYLYVVLMVDQNVQESTIYEIIWCIINICILDIWIYQIFKDVMQGNPMSTMPSNLLLEPQSQLLPGEYSLVPRYSTDQILCHISPHRWSKYCHLTLQLHKLDLLRRPKQFLACKDNKNTLASGFVSRKKAAKKLC